MGLVERAGSLLLVDVQVASSISYVYPGGLGEPEEPEELEELEELEETEEPVAVESPQYIQAAPVLEHVQVSVAPL